jgi:hypothetical protein
MDNLETLDHQVHLVPQDLQAQSAHRDQPEAKAQLAVMAHQVQLVLQVAQVQQVSQGQLVPPGR